MWMVSTGAGWPSYEPIYCWHHHHQHHHRGNEENKKGTKEGRKEGIRHGWGSEGGSGVGIVDVRLCQCTAIG